MTNKSIQAGIDRLDELDKLCEDYSPCLEEVTFKQLRSILTAMLDAERPAVDEEQCLQDICDVCSNLFEKCTCESEYQQGFNNGYQTGLQDKPLPSSELGEPWKYDEHGNKLETDTISISRREYEELKDKAWRYDELNK